jgi:hypothetical protein
MILHSEENHEDCDGLEEKRSGKLPLGVPRMWEENMTMIVKASGSVLC